MADFQAHIQQANRNLSVLSGINKHIKDSWDWQVTCCYYVAVHLMNAHIAKTVNLHYKTHVEVKKAIYNDLWPCKVSDDVYTSFASLENLSRRSRYLCNDLLNKNDDNLAYLTFDVHLKKALNKLDKIISYFSTLHNIKFENIDIDCIEIKGSKLGNFTYRN